MLQLIPLNVSLAKPWQLDPSYRWRLEPIASWQFPRTTEAARIARHAACAPPLAYLSARIPPSECKPK
eukprot:4487454-Pyramimonas_sp.AAC.1